LLRWSRPNYRLSLVTSGSRATIDLALARLGFANWFDPILTADDLEQAKPDPQGFLQAVQISGSAPEQALVFEDSAAGFEAARRAGLDVVDATRLESMMIKGAADGD
jgi:HAD superfamily hydrolase (TIGR01509 family)